MAFIRVPFATGKELPLAEKGKYHLVIRQFRTSVSERTGRQYFSASFAFTNGEASDFRQTFFCPLPADKPETARRFAGEIRRLFKTFSIPFEEDGAEEEQGFSDENVVGATAVVYVTTGTETDRDGNEVEVNKIRLDAAKD